jgi:flagellar FliL protein
MAVKERVHDDEPEGDDDEAPKKKAKKDAGPMKLVIVGAIALFVAVLGAQVAAPILTKIIAGDPSAAGKEEATDEAQLALADELAEDPQSEGGEEEQLKPAIYTPLDPPFVVSFEDAEHGSRFLQLTLQAMARDEHTIDEVKTHAPALRNAFLFLISSYKVEDLATLQGKEKLRAEMLASANEIMERNTGKAGIEEIFFTSLVIQ